MGARRRHSIQTETTMIALYDQFQELRAELQGCVMSRRERAQAEAELAKAIAEQAEIERAFDRALSAQALDNA
jgi:hypothetical protein